MQASSLHYLVSFDTSITVTASAVTAVAATAAAVTATTAAGVVTAPMPVFAPLFLHMFTSLLHLLPNLLPKLRRKHTTDETCADWCKLSHASMAGTRVVAITGTGGNSIAHGRVGSGYGGRRAGG